MAEHKDLWGNPEVVHHKNGTTQPWPEKELALLGDVLPILNVFGVVLVWRELHAHGQSNQTKTKLIFGNGINRSMVHEIGPWSMVYVPLRMYQSDEEANKPPPPPPHPPWLDLLPNKIVGQYTILMFG